MMENDVKVTQADAFRTAMVDAARARGGAGAEFIAKGHTNLWLDIAFDAAAALTRPTVASTTEGNICDCCKHSFLAVYRVPNDVWRKIAPKPDTLGDFEEHLGGGVLCLSCAERRARDQGCSLVFDGLNDWSEADDKDEQLHKALKPFALSGVEHENAPDEWSIWESPAALDITFGDLRSARDTYLARQREVISRAAHTATPDSTAGTCPATDAADRGGR